MKCKQCKVNDACTPGGFCSQKCSAVYGWKGSRNPRWNNGATTVSGGLYVAVKQADHPRANIHGYVRQHYLIMEKFLGRYLLLEEEVHHRNGNKKDNWIGNLQLISSRSEHLKLEHKLGTYKKHLINLNIRRIYE